MTVAVTPSQPASAPSGSLWRDRNFATFLIGESVSLAGTQVSQIALPLTAIYLFHAGPREVGLLRGAQLVPYLLFSLALGIWIDRHRKRPLMIAANIVRFAFVVAVPLLYATGGLRLPYLYAAAFVVGAAAVAFDLASMSFLPAVVQGRERLLDANSKLGTINFGTAASGPAVGGALVSALTAPVALVADAMSYLVSLATLLLVRTSEPAPIASADRRPATSELAEGLRFVFRDRHLRPLALVGASYNMFSIAVTTMLLLYAVDDLRFSAAGLGGLLSAGAVAGVAGSLAARRLLGRWRLGPVYAVSVSCAFVGPILIPTAAGPRWLVVSMLVTACALMSGSGGVSNVLVLTMRQVRTPDRLLGRMNAGFRTALYGGGALGGPVGGLLGARFGLRPGLWIICSAAILMVLVVALSPVSRLDAMPDTA